MAGPDNTYGHVHVHNLFLWSMAVIYLFAFASLYHQQPGLYGDHGIKPVARDFTKSPPLDFPRLLHYFLDIKPTLLWVTQALQIDTQTGMDLLAISGIVLASIAIITRFARNSLILGSLWVIYLSLNSVGTVFLSDHWDLLLLEAGFLAFLFAPFPLLMPDHVHTKLASIGMWPLRWLLFRVMFMQGVLKLQSGCPTWWKLTAMNHYYETQGLPTFAAWFFHQLPQWVGSLTLLHALFSELVLPWIFFAPTRGLRKFAFYNVIILELGIIATGNFNFYNLLLVVLSLSLLGDYDLGYRFYPRTYSGFKSVVSGVFNLAAIGGLLFFAGYFAGIKYSPKNFLIFQPRFTENDFNRALEYAWPASVILALTSLFWRLLTTVSKTERHDGFFTVLHRIIFLGPYVVALLAVFALSLSPYSKLVKSSVLGPIDTSIRQAHKTVEKFGITNGYGLFRRMPGVDGRLEITLEGSNRIESGWEEYEFLYKPVEVNRAPPFVIPHQPRLDWQMWVAAQGDPRSSQWINTLIYRLLEGQPEVLRLVVDPSSAMAKKPPKFIRARLYKYWLTKEGSATSSSTGKTDWWKRKFERPWIAPVSLSDESFMSLIRSQGLGDLPKTDRTNLKELRYWLKWIRMQAESVSAPVFIWTLFMVNIVFHRTLKAFHL